MKNTQEDLYDNTDWVELSPWEDFDEVLTGGSTLRKVEVPSEIKTPEKSSKFRLSSKKLFLTYPKCDLPLRYVIDCISKRLTKYCIEEYLAVREFHEDFSKHIHIYLELARRIQTRDPTILDIKCNNNDSNTFHGNYQVCKNKQDTINYLLKDHVSMKQSETLIYSSGFDTMISSTMDFKCIDRRIIELAEMGKIQIAMNLIKKEDPRRYVNSGDRIEKRLNEIFMKTMGFSFKYDFKSFNIPSTLQNILDKFKERESSGEGFTLVLLGKPGCGKTQLLLSFFEQHLEKKCLRISNLDGLRFLNNSYGSVIADDVDWGEVSRESLLSFVDKSSHNTVNIKHKSALLLSTILKAICSNYGPYKKCPHFRDPAIRRRIVVFYIDGDTVLYNKIGNDSVN